MGQQRAGNTLVEAAYEDIASPIRTVQMFRFRCPGEADDSAIADLYYLAPVNLQHPVLLHIFDLAEIPYVYGSVFKPRGEVSLVGSEGQRREHYLTG